MAPCTYGFDNRRTGVPLDAEKKSIPLGRSIEPYPKRSSEPGCQTALNAVSHRPVLLLCLIWNRGFGFAKSAAASRFQIRSRLSLHVVSSLLPVTGDQYADVTDLPCGKLARIFFFGTPFAAQHADIPHCHRQIV